MIDALPFKVSKFLRAINHNILIEKLLRNSLIKIFGKTGW
jgi:hypothetical protein